MQWNVAYLVGPHFSGAFAELRKATVSFVMSNMYVFPNIHTQNHILIDYATNCGLLQARIRLSFLEPFSEKL